MTSIKLFGDFDKYLLKLWFEEFQITRYIYKEPILDSMTVDLIKRLCNALKQDSHVFVMSVDILVQYIMIQNNKNIVIEDQVLIVLTVIFICSKIAGEQSDLKPLVISKFYTNITEEDIATKTVNLAEIHVLKTLHHRLPFFSRIDDLKTFLNVYLKDFKLRVDIVGLSVQILDIVYIYYRRLFYKLKNVYKQSPDALQTFQEVITNRLYLPSGILLCALEMTKLKHFMNTETILDEISDLCNINRNHIELLSRYIYDIICVSGNSSSNTVI
ncbi:Cyclin, N-terminal domain [Popillia japonica]|uniref:Cyclin, N-terminal domain n=1 Tax=Popillia japonica TaxID=7064 RepID=A0AAW1LZU6_POPJA